MGMPLVPRPDLDAQVTAWLQDESAPRFLMVSGAPGTGKTTWARMLAGSGGQFGTAIAASHFCLPSTIATRSPLRFLENVCGQLARAYPSFAKALLTRSARPRDVAVRVKQHVETSPGAQVVGVHIEQLNVGEEPAEDVLQAVLTEPLAAVGGAGEPWVILVDALDEAIRYSGKVTIPQLLLGLGDLPLFVRFVVTAQPDRALESDFDRVGATRVDLDQRVSSREAVVSFVQTAMLEPSIAARLPPETQKQTITALAEKAGSNFLVAESALSALQTVKGSIGPEAISGLPGNLPGLYLEYLSRRFGRDPDNWHRSLGPIAGLLAIAAEPLSEAQIAAATGKSSGEVRRRLRELRRFLESRTTSSGAEGWGIYHRTFAEFLLDGSAAEEFWCPEEEQHSLVLAWARQSGSDWRAVDWQRADPYVLRHVVRHLVAARRDRPDLESLEALLAGGFVAAKAVIPGESPTLVEDFRRALSAARKEGDARRVFLFGLVLACWRDRLAKGAAPEAVPILIKLGRTEEAIQLAGQREAGGATRSTNDAYSTHVSMVHTVAEIAGAEVAFAVANRIAAPDAAPDEFSGLLTAAAEALADHDPGGALRLMRAATASACLKQTPWMSDRACGLLATHAGYADVALEFAGDRDSARAAVVVGIAIQDVERALALTDDIVFRFCDHLIEDAGGERIGISREAFRARVLTSHARANRASVNRVWGLADQLLGSRWDFAEGLPLACALANGSADLGQQAFLRLDRGTDSAFLTNALAAAAVGSCGGPGLLSRLMAHVPEGLKIWRGMSLEPRVTVSAVCITLERLDLESITAVPGTAPLLRRFAAALLQALAAREDVPEFKGRAEGVLGSFFGLLGICEALQFVAFVQDTWKDKGTGGSRAAAGAAAGLAVAHPGDLVRALEQRRFFPEFEHAVRVAAAEVLARRDTALAIDLGLAEK